MQFKHPEILYALFLLIIPIIIHLFQLQKFKKVAFTNVELLKQIEQQTRKSSKLKKWLILLTRLLAFTCLIFAFAQPFFSNNSINQNYHTSIYLDNSFSMQAKGENGELLKSISQTIIETIKGENNSFSLITNDNQFTSIDEKTLKTELKNITYSSNNNSLSSVLLQINNLNNNKTNSLHKNILISDFQSVENSDKSIFKTVKTPVYLVKTSPVKNDNIYIDSVYFSNHSSTEITLNVLSKSVKKTSINIPISLYNDTVLIGKAVVKFSESNKATTQFTIANPTEFKGKLTLNNDDLSFDDTFYFYLEKTEKINVLSIGEPTEFIKKIYTNDEFNLTISPIQNLNYSGILQQHLIVLNAIENIPVELATTLNEFIASGGNLVIIPSEEINLPSYNTLFKTLAIGTISAKLEQEQKVTSINFDHLLLNNVFEKEVQNFEYPTVKSHYKTTLTNNEAVLKFASNEAFIASTKPSKGMVYWIASALNTTNSNFIQSSLVVPVFYNFGKNSLKIAQPYYTIQPETVVEIGAQIGKDQVLSISTNESEFIPLQEIFQNKVRITINNNNLKSGFYTIKNGETPLKKIAFNYNRFESDLNYAPLNQLTETNKNIEIASSIGTLFDEYYSDQKINWLFKWFLAFSILFLLIEMLILKYFKT